MSTPWTQALLAVAVAAILVASVLVGARLLRVRAREVPPTRRRTYECGEEPDGPAWIRFHPRYYLVALVFVLFDVEAAFLFPWAAALDGLGVAALVEMGLFLGILALGWLYALRKGALKWQ